jgi:hypothetical protein
MYFSAVQFWALCQGANIMNPHVELVVLALVDVLFLSACCIVRSQQTGVSLRTACTLAHSPYFVACLIRLRRH